jgi:NAD(P)-dependent dehydrogenase (short-subunit alcohol dehydrogenase family)
MPTCLITGSNRGIGLEFARQYAAEGWRVIAACRRPNEAVALKDVDGDVDIRRLDVTDFAQIEDLAHALKGAAIDILINNAGVYGPRVTPYAAIDYGAWSEVLRANTMAPLKMAASFAEHLARSEKKCLVALSSAVGSIAENTSGGTYLYRSSKAALNAVMRSLSIDLKDKGIAVAILHPGWVRTDMGGSGAKINAVESVSAMRGLIDGWTLESSGRFFAYDGREIPW